MTEAGGRPRGPGITYVVVTLVLVVLLAAFAMTSRQPPPPTIAEFAPQAVENITDAPNDQSSTVGRAGGAGGVGGAEETPTPAPDAKVDIPRVRKCVGDPPRQIEDPQSPPCVPYWAGDNGGATAKGVTRNEIKLVGGYSPNMITFFNQRFEFYGRKLVVVERPSTAPNAGCSEGAQAQADADASLQPFATDLFFGSCMAAYIGQSARNRVINVSAPQAPMPETFLSSLAPFAWSYQMAFENMQRNLGAWACDRLNGGVAAHAGAGSVGKQRVFGLVYRDADLDTPKDTQILKSSLAACGIEFEYVAAPAPADGGGSAAPVDYTNVVVNMQRSGVTTVFSLIGRQDMASMFQAADNQSYYPEWLITSMYWNDHNWSIRNLGGSLSQREHLFGLTMQPMQRRFSDHPSTWANGQSARSDGSQALGQDQGYRPLLLLASGIQMAGPHLTPQTFQDALHRTRFPNPETPLMAGHVGFGGGSHAMTIDAAEIWWSNTAAGPYADEATGGAWCYVAHGERHSLSNRWPAGDPLFQQPCDSGGQAA